LGKRKKSKLRAIGERKENRNDRDRLKRIQSRGNGECRLSSSGPSKGDFINFGKPGWVKAPPKSFGWKRTEGMEKKDELRVMERGETRYAVHGFKKLERSKNPRRGKRDGTAHGRYPF